MISHRERGWLVSRKLPGSGVFFGSDSQQFVTVFDVRGAHTMPIRSDLNVNYTLYVGGTCEGRVERH